MKRSRFNEEQIIAILKEQEAGMATAEVNETLFTSLAHARFVLAAWQHDYNTVRPHSKLGGKTPAEIAGQRVWGHAPRHVAIPSNNHHEGARLYL